MENSVKQRIITLIKYYNLSQKRFEEKAGLSNGYVNSLKHAPSATKLQSIFDAFPDVSREWLLTGEGEMLNPVTNNTTVNGGNAIGNGSGNVNHVNTNDVIEILHEQLRVKDEQIKGLIAALNK